MLRAPTTGSPLTSPLSEEEATVSVTVPAEPDNFTVVGAESLMEALAEYVFLLAPRS